MSEQEMTTMDTATITGAVDGETFTRDITDKLMGNQAAVLDRLPERPAHRRELIAGGNPDAVIAIPGDGDFEDNGRDFLPAGDAEHVGPNLIAGLPEFAHLQGLDIGYLWKRKGGKREGKTSLAFCQKLSGMVKFYSRLDFVVWIGADVARELTLTAWQFEALLHHELLHAAIDPEKGMPSVAGHDFEGFSQNLRRYGAWRDDLIIAKDVFEQLALDGIAR